MLVSHSSLSTFLTCPRKWRHVYVDRRTPKTTPKALLVGRSIDSALKNGTTPDDPVERAMMLGWRVRWRDDPLQITETDIRFEHEIGDGIVMQGEIDAIAGDTAIEWKTTSHDISPGSSYWQRVLLIDAQVSVYLAALRERGITKLVYDVLRKPDLERQKATPEDKRQYTKPTKKNPEPRLYANQRERDESPDEFSTRVLEAIAEDPERYYQRAPIVRLEADHADFVRDVKGTVRLMQAGVAPRNPGACFQFRRCEYFDVCTGQVRIDDDNYFMDRTRTQGPQSHGAEARDLRPTESRKVDVQRIDARPNRYRF